MRTPFLFLLACITFWVLLSMGFQGKQTSKSTHIDCTQYKYKEPVPARIDCTKWWCCETTRISMCCPDTPAGEWTVKSASGSFKLPETLMLERIMPTGSKVPKMGKKFELRSFKLIRQTPAK